MQSLLSLLQSKWAAGCAGAVLFLLTTSLLIARAIPTLEIPESSPPPHDALSTYSWDFHNPELDQLIEELQKEKTALDRKENELNDLALRLETEQAELQELIAQIETMQSDFDKAVLQIKEEEILNLKKLAKIYAAMKPASAMVILKELDEDTLTKIFAFMKEDQTAPILDALAQQSDEDARRAAQISERLRLSSFRQNIP